MSQCDGRIVSAVILHLFNFWNAFHFDGCGNALAVLARVHPLSLARGHGKRMEILLMWLCHALKMSYHDYSTGWVWMMLRILSASESNFRCYPEAFSAVGGRQKMRFQLSYDMILFHGQNKNPVRLIKTSLSMLWHWRGESIYKDSSTSGPGFLTSLPQNFRGPPIEGYKIRGGSSNNHGSLESSKTMGFFFEKGGPPSSYPIHNVCPQSGVFLHFLSHCLRFPGVDEKYEMHPDSDPSLLGTKSGLFLVFPSWWMNLATWCEDL